VINNAAGLELKMYQSLLCKNIKILLKLCTPRWTEQRTEKKLFLR